MNKLFNNVMRSASNAVTKVKGYKYTPKVLMVVGITTIVASGVYACKQTLKLEERIDDAKAEIDHIKELKEDGEYVVNEETGETAEYTDKLYRKDMAYAWAHGLWGIGKLYIVPVVGTVIGVGCVCEGDAINTERVAALTLACTAWSEKFGAYRGNVRREYGDEVDQKMMTGVEVKKNLEMNVIDPETGELKTKTEKKVDVIMDIKNVASPYAIIMNDCAWWREDSNYDEICINAKLSMLQARLSSQHYLYFYDILREFEILDNVNVETIAMAHQTGIIEGYGDGDLRANPINTSLGSEDFFKKILLLDFNCIGGDYVDGKYVSFNDLVSGRCWLDREI